MGKKFTLQVFLLQPRSSGGPPAAWKVRARWVAGGSGSTNNIVEDALSDRRNRTLDVHRPPPGVGTSWQVEAEGARYRIDDVQLLAGTLKVLRLSCHTTGSTGELLGEAC